MIYTDWSKTKTKEKSKRVPIIKEKEELGNYMSINNKCSVYTAEALAVCEGTANTRIERR